MPIGFAYLWLPLGSIHGDRWVVGQGPKHRHLKVFALGLFPWQQAHQNRAPVVAVVLRQHLRTLSLRFAESIGLRVSKARSVTVGGGDT